MEVVKTRVFARERMSSQNTETLQDSEAVTAILQWAIPLTSQILSILRVTETGPCRFLLSNKLTSIGAGCQ